MLAVAGLTGCSEDRDPKYHNPTEFVLNTPALQQQYYELTDGGQFYLTCSQPDYGYSAITQYGAQVSLTEDFAVYEELVNKTPTMAKMTFNDADLAVALCVLNDITTEEQKAEYEAMPAQRVYFRATASLKGVEGSAITSNVVYLDQVKGYFAVPVPGYIYLVGQPEGWAGPTASNAAHYADWRLFESETAIGSKIYQGVFDIPAGSAMFRFYTDLTGWDADSYGSQPDDSPIDFDIDGDSFDAPIVKGKGSFNFPNWEGGEMTIVVNMVDMTLTIYKGAQSVATPRYIYMVGNNAGWAEPSEANAASYEDWKLVDNNESGVYTNTFDFAGFAGDGEGNLYCRFYQELTGWGAAQWSAAADGSNVDIRFNMPMTTVEGEGCFFGNVKDQVVTITLDTNNNTISFDL